MFELVRSQINVKGRFQRAGVGAGLFTRKCEGKVSEGCVGAGSFTTKCEGKVSDGWSVELAYLQGNVKGRVS